MKIIRSFLLKCSILSSNQEFLHEWARQMALQLELPLIRFFYRISSRNRIISIRERHSIKEPGGFNLFLSDIDLTIVVKDVTSIPRSMSIFKRIKIIFPNLGEPEIITRDEDFFLQYLYRPEYEDFWKKIFLIRKINWQLEKMKNSPDQLENFKIGRGLKKCLQKLHSPGLHIDLSICFKDLSHFSHNELSLKTPYYDQYLGAWIEVQKSRRNYCLIAKNEQEVHILLGLLPGNLHLEQLSNVPLMKYLNRREQLLSLCQLRILMVEGKDTHVLEAWIKKLDIQFHQLLQSNGI